MQTRRPARRGRVHPGRGRARARARAGQRRRGAGGGAVLKGLAPLVLVVVAALLALHVARRAAGGAVAEVSGPRALALADLARRHGTLVAVLQRLVPGIPDVPFFSLVGAIGLRTWQVTVGTLVGSAPPRLRRHRAR